MKMILIAAAAFVLVVGIEEARISFLKGDIQERDKQIAELNASLAVEKANVSTLSARIESQNNAVEALEAEKAAMNTKVREKALAAKRKKNKTPVNGSGVDSMNLFFERTYQ